ncbi:glutamyl-tRNA reductase [Flammeovirga sp. EKP202]|uniref:glutamyl-tRNA reductase n=1 Tax=Flammeovirga sp. EKP202 TaxID=2770592 RepID=UPI00165FB95E|nr:glutamyl-tRNA reductase [Flammeovirga sp. EKP202]MBD0402984.1 glutamyl-tRNA reductase [Flammeovirga sp. EKP202]
MTNDLKLFSISHSKATVKVREKFSLNDLEVKHFLQKLKEVLGIDEAIVLSTCNRVEVYYVSKSILTQQILKLLCVLKCQVPSDQYIKYIEDKEGDNAVEHLFSTGIGVNSLLLGDLQIYGQLKNAYQNATDENMCQAFLHRLMHTFFHFHKRITNETSFKKGVSSNGYAAVKVTDEFCKYNNDAKILIIGLGEMGKDVCQYLQKKNINNVSITNRSLEKALQFNKTFGYEVVDYETHEEMLFDFDVVITSAHHEKIVYKPSISSSQSPQLIIDLCSPRTVSPTFNRVGTKVLNIDDLGMQLDETIKLRQAELTNVSLIFNEELLKFNSWLKETYFTPTVLLLKNALEELRRDSLATFKKEFNSSELEAIERVSNRMIQKIVQLPTLQLKEACKQGNVATLNEALKALFMLEEPSIHTSKI